MAKPDADRVGVWKPWGRWRGVGVGHMKFDAMVLAAGYGRRLRPLTDEIPKALVAVGGLTQLERTLRAIEGAGGDRIVVNTHHHAEQVEAAIARRSGEAEILVSREDPRPLETGGGLMRARGMFRGDRPILVHNVDVISEIDLRALIAGHRRGGALATLAVHERAATRYLLFDVVGLQGRIEVRSGRREEVRAQTGPLRRMAFAGIHVAAPHLFGHVIEDGPFSIIDLYLRLAGEGRFVEGVDVGDAAWLEVGTPERLAAARARFGG